MKRLNLLGLCLLINTAVAGPIYSTSCVEAKYIMSPKYSMGYFMSKDCKTAYVLPPSRGITNVVGKTVGDLSRCNEIKQFSKSLKKINIEINKVISINAEDESIKKLFEQRKYIIDQYSDLSRTLGASIELNFSSGIGENLAAFQNLNPNSEVNFVSVALKDVKLAWNQSTVFEPEMKVAFNQSVPVSDLNSFGVGSFNARLDLSLIGACPLSDPFDHEFPNKLKAKDVSGVITPNLIYSYDMGATYKYHAEYNLSSLASRIREYSSKGGLFKTSSTSSLIETAESSGWFKFAMECDDSRICDKAKEETAYSIKQRLIKEVLDNIAVGTIGHVIPVVDSAKPGANGASIAADGLRKCPNVYCQVSAVVLDVGNAIFGGTNQTDSYVKNNNHVVIEDVTENRPVSFSGVLGFGQ